MVVADVRAGGQQASECTPLTPAGDFMIRLAYAQRSLVEVLLPDGEKLWDPVLRRIDAELEDEGLLDVMVEALARRRPLSQRRGRPGTPATVVLRMLVLKHLFDWSFDECEHEVRANLVYRAFCRIEGERVPDAKTLIRLAQVLDGPTLKQLLERLVVIAGERRVVRGRRLRVDTTVVETNIHYPTDSTLLADGVRVLTRTLKRLRATVTDGVVPLRDRTRSVARRVFAIVQLSRRAGQDLVKTRMRTLYRQLMGHTRAVVRQAESAVQHVAAGTVGAVGLAQLEVEGLAQQLREAGGLVRRVLAQTRARILAGNTHYPDKLLSLFEPHTEAIRKGKAVKPTEFGKLVKIQEAEAQFITDYEVCETRVPDQALWVPSLVRHAELFGHAPRLAVADAGFASRLNERAARDRGVQNVVLLRQRRQGCSRAIRAALRWRTGCEGRISALKRRHGLRRCRYRGLVGMARWVGLGVIANDLLVLGRAGPRTR
jgi:IS5 family transposase